MAALVGELKPAGGAEALREAYQAGRPDPAFEARAAALAALAEFGAAEAVETLKAALADKDWAVRMQAATLLRKLEPGADYRAAIRPGAGDAGRRLRRSPAHRRRRSHPMCSSKPRRARSSSSWRCSTRRRRRSNFMALARRGFFNGLQVHRVVPNFVMQDGDPRGDGEGGPGYAIRDELNDRPYLRGTVGMALTGTDTGGSQFFITHSPQPHLDAKYTVFGHVVNGMDVVDRIAAVGHDPAGAGVGRRRRRGACRSSAGRTGETKKGATAAPFLSRVRGSLTLLAALLLRPALGRLLCHCAYPPLHSWDSDREELSPHRSAAAIWHVGLPLSAPVAFLR